MQASFESYCMLSYPAGSWMPAVLSSDLPAGTVIAAQTPSGQVALWRSQSGRAVAFADRCPHRGMRLSHGFVRGEKLSCIYHGWSYGEGGNCLRIPAHPELAPPETIRAASRPVTESGGLVWISESDSGEAPPRFDGLVPLRSMTVEADIAALEAAAGAKADGGLLVRKQNDQALRLLLAPLGDARTLIHVLMDENSTPSPRIAASRAAEALRRTAEDIAQSRTAA